MEMAEAQDDLGADMSRRPATFTKADLSRAMAVAREHGMTVEVQADGTIRIVPLTGGKPARVDYAGEIRL